MHSEAALKILTKEAVLTYSVVLCAFIPIVSFALLVSLRIKLVLSAVLSVVVVALMAKLLSYVHVLSDVFHYVDIINSDLPENSKKEMLNGASEKVG